MNLVHTPPCYFCKTDFNNIFPSTPRPSKGFLSFRFSYQNPICISLHPLICLLSHYTWCSHPINAWWEAQIIKLPNMHTLFCYLLHLRPTYLPQRPLLIQSLPVFFPLCQRPGCVSIHNRQNYSSLYFNVYVFSYETGEHKIQEWMVAGIPRIYCCMQLLFVSMVPKYMNFATFSKD